MYVNEFFDKNGIEFFDTDTGYSHISDGYDQQLKEEGFNPDEARILDETVFYLAEQLKFKEKCLTRNCGNRVMVKGERCYYCHKKNQNLIKE